MPHDAFKHFMTDQRQKGHTMFDMRKASALVAAGALVASLGLAGCGGDQTGTTETKTDDTTTEEVPDDATKEDAKDDTGSNDVEATVWTEVASAKEAYEKAGFEGDFVVPDTLVAHGIDFANPKFSYADGVVKATYDQPASAVEIRKGIGPAGTVKADDDTGYMGESFKETWEVETPDGVRVTCYGGTKGEVIFAQWYGEAPEDGQSDAYSLHAMGLGGEDIPMTEEELVAIVSAVK